MKTVILFNRQTQRPRPQRGLFSAGNSMIFA